MTINEIENTLTDLRARHHTLDEAMLTTLLSSSGWEEKTIQEAVTLFKSSEPHHVRPLPRKNEAVTVNHVTGAPSPEGSPVIATAVNTPSAPSIPPKTPETLIASQTTNKKSEPESLVVRPQENFVSKRVDPPENLPLQPFETSPHTMPLATYKEVFHQDKKEVAQVPTQTSPSKTSDTPTTHITIKPTSLDREDEGLIMLTGVMLVMVLLLLAYMYTNGRL